MKFNPFSAIKDRIVNHLMGLTYDKCLEIIKYTKEAGANIKKKGIEKIIGMVESFLNQESEDNRIKAEKGLLYFIGWYAKQYKDHLKAINKAYTDINFLRKSAEYKKDPGVVDKFLNVHKYINELGAPLEIMYKTAIAMDLALKEGKKEKLRKDLTKFKEQLEKLREITIKYGY